MKIKVNKTEIQKNAEVAVIIGRFQVNKLHPGHRSLINYVLDNHKKVIILLGVSRIQNTRKNPLDFASRKAMLQKEFPSVTILPIRDQRYNEKWSKDVDSIIPIVYGEKSTVIYGSRDSFIPYYSGKFPVIELEESVTYNGTNIREEVARETINSDDFRSGVIYSAYNQRGTAYQTVDIAVVNDQQEMLLARKPNEKFYRFIGGFVDVEDTSLETAALRELREEASVNLVTGTPQYITSQKVDDWRYKGEDSGIMTTLFLAKYRMGMASANDDIEEVKWVKIKDLSNWHGIRTKIMPEHRELMKVLIDKIYDQNLVANLGDRLEEVKNVTYTME